MKQYCKYCAFCISGDKLYCTNFDKVLSYSLVSHTNNCADFALSELGDCETGKQYKLHERKSKQIDGQITMFNE